MLVIVSLTKTKPVQTTKTGPLTFVATFAKYSVTVSSVVPLTFFWFCHSVLLVIKRKYITSLRRPHGANISKQTMCNWVNRNMQWGLRHEVMRYASRCSMTKFPKWTVTGLKGGGHDPMPPKDALSCPCLPRGPCTCANLHRNRFILFQNIVFPSLVTDGQTEGRTDERADM